MVETILQDRVKREGKKEKADEAVLTTFEEARTNNKRRRTDADLAPTVSVREETKRARLYEKADTPLNCELCIICPEDIYPAAGDERREYDVDLDEDDCTTEYVTCDNYSFEELLERATEVLQLEKDRYIRELRGVNVLANPPVAVPLSESNVKAWWTGLANKKMPKVLVILGRETIEAFEKRIHAVDGPDRPDTPLPEGKRYLPPVVDDPGSLPVVDDKNIANADFVGTTGIPRTIVGFEAAIASHMIKVRQHYKCVRTLVRERRKQAIDEDPITPFDPAWNHYIKLCPLEGLDKRQFGEVAIKRSRIKAREAEKAERDEDDQ